MNSAGETRVTINRWVNTYLVKAMGAATIQDLPRRIDRCVAEELAASCTDWLRRRVDVSSPAVWRIRELDLNFVVDMSSGPAGADVAHAWSERVATRISEVIDHGTDSDGVLYFENRAAYLAQFALDLAAGRAWGMWYYQEFAALEMLSSSRAMCDAFTREPEHGAQAVLQLSATGRLEEMLSVLSEADAETVYSRCFGNEESHASSQDLPRWSGGLLELWNEMPMLPGSGDKKFHQALRWLAAAAARYPGAEDDTLALACVEGLLELRRVLVAMHSPMIADRLVRDLVEGRVSAEGAIEVASQHGSMFPQNGLRFLYSVARDDPDWAAQAVAALLRDQQPAAQTAFAGESMITLFGGIFLLGPALIELNLGEIAAALEGSGEMGGVLRHIVLAKCLGGERAREAIADPALRILSGYSQPDLHESCKAFSPLDLAPAQALFARSLITLTGCEGRCLLAETIQLPGKFDDESSASERETTVCAIALRDIAGNEWLYASVLPADTAAWEQVLLAGVDLVSALTGNIPHLLLAGDLAMLSESHALRDRVDRLLVIEEGGGSEVTEVLALAGCVTASTPLSKIVLMLASSQPEFQYLSLLDCGLKFDSDLDLNLDLFSSLLARSALKGFARRLKGFQSSSPQHLAQNFLEGASTLRVLPERIEVELPRSPLTLLLQLSGLTRQRYAVPWLEGREVWLLPPQE